MDRLRWFFTLCFVTQAFHESVSAHSQRVKRQLDPRRRDTYIPNYIEAPESGPWGPWTESSQCSRTCGGGVAHQDRLCMDTRPDGSHSCTGAYRRYFSCNVQDCPQGSRDFRELQCARFNTVPHKGIFYSWEPYHHPHNPCELFCSAKGGSFYKKTDSKVIDGTKCRSDGSLDICVDGQCMPVGCDNVLGSTKTEDQCRVCGGDGSSCSVVSGVFDDNQLDVGYNDILLIPAGATAIFIEKTEPTKNFLAVRNSEGRYYLNGHWKIEFPRQLVFAGTVFHYERKPQGTAPEVLRAQGPTSEALFIVLLYQEKNLGIQYKYAVPAPAKTPAPNSYLWTTGEFEPCSQTCGGGSQARPVRCLRESDRDIVDERLCDPLLKPPVQETCNNQPCPSQWQIGDWSDCSAACGGGVQVRVVYCHRQEDGNAVLVPDESCPQPKPLFMRSCNLDKECPEWTTGDWSECDSVCGTGSQNRSVSCHSKEAGEAVEEGLCPPDRRPPDSQTCTLGPCEGVEWIVSEWSGCDGSCNPRLESREVHCANEEGAVFPEGACEASKMPPLTRPCPQSDMCEPMWHTSQWTECSVKCGSGVESRVVFCGAWQDEAVIKIDDEKCDPLLKFEETRECHAPQPCQGTWFTGPWNRCSVPCGGGERSRKILCFHDDEVVDSGQCDLNEEPDDKENCNMTPCDDDEMMSVGGGCKSTQHGCCPDGVTPAGAHYENCANLNISGANVSCEEAEFGCCADNFTLALGPFKKGCATNCTDSKHGCCPDGRTPATGPEMEGCPDLGDCSNSTHGCCPDGASAASGPNGTGCEGVEKKGGSGLDIEIESSGEDCYGQEFGCCPDGLTPAAGPDQEGCEEVENGTDCRRSAFGCCDDGAMPAKGPLKENCMDFDGSGEGDLAVPCEESVFGCCPDNQTAARGFDLEGCFGCLNTTFGCCADNVTFANGPDGEGCPVDCSNTTFGCCADNVTVALGPDGQGCTADCANSTHGCCPDNVTTASGPDGLGCTPEDCSNTTFGCCPDNVTAATGQDGQGCPIDCSNTTFGCCPDNVTAATGQDGQGCPIDCSNTTFGCCPDNVTAAVGQDGQGCPIDCSNTTFGCCPDNVTAAAGQDGEGCPLDCSNTTFGCCPDNVTAAAGQDGEGCPIDCSNTTFGCCPDNVTAASGPDDGGCNVTIACADSLYGCCPDNGSVALGPDFEGCDCQSADHGCCPDNATAALGPDGEGCPNATTTEAPQETLTTLAECATAPFGCCPDEVTPALGSNLEGCCFGLRFGCCPDNKTAALGPTFLGCGCQTYPYGCCPDNITPAQGPNYVGCRCEQTRHGCCQDGVTPAKGPQGSGCPDCRFLHYGCCPDGATPARGERGEGCGCDSTRFGCCPDGVTAAASPDLSGCPCATLPYGCCPDGHTPARTPDLRDCPCESQRYGCCPDGRTASRGPSFEGCPCDSTRFGCCQDGRTPARGPGFEGCPCETTPFGCCADNYTPARGPRFEGCPQVLVPKPKVSTEVCSLPKEAGPCRNYTIKWFFDLGYGGCSRFWYGGCDGNGNLFATQDECESVCVKPQGPEVCLLPMVKGSCDGKVTSWYFDAGSKTCETFTYGGCLGNNNKFATKTDCVEKCINNNNNLIPTNEVCPEVVCPPGSYRDENPKQCPTCVPLSSSVCSEPKDAGGCESAIVKWWFNGERCEQFYYGGCKGNGNRFGSRLECEKACRPQHNATEGGVCQLPHEIGPCNDFRERWYFDPDSAQCRRFFYGGCKGNDNNFGSLPECEKRCAHPETPNTDDDAPFKTDYCFQLQDTGPCTSNEVSWYYDSKDGVCKEFYYGGCKGNRNRFQTRKECEKSCFKAQDVCTLPAVRGPCSGTFSQWYYDGSQDECLEFTFSGCQGNGNRFNDREACQQRCQKTPPTTRQTPQVVDSDVCGLPKDPGPCLGYYRSWYYEAGENACKSFIYGGCDGNENRFVKRRECEQRCVAKKTPKDPKTPLPDRTQKAANEDVCRLPVDAGGCGGEQPRWFYDAQTQSCLPFVYGGCEGNKNRFKTAEICLRFCSGIKVKPDVRGVEVPFVTVPPVVTTTTPPNKQCPPSNCGEVQCPYGIEETFDVNGCSSCRCSNPCEVQICPEGSRCVVDVVRTSRDAVRTEPICRRVEKSGSCPVASSVVPPPRDCEQRCRDDADCRGEHKCCHNGCALTCAPPQDEKFDEAKRPEPASILPGANVTRGAVGRPAELPCRARGWPEPTVTWWRDTTMLPLSSSRYQQMPDHALLIRSVVREDGGDYACHAHNGIGSGATYRVTLLIDFSDVEPAHPPSPVDPYLNVPVSSSVTLVTPSVTAGSPLQLDCVTEGPPDTRVTWQQGDVPLVADDRRRILSNHTLFVTRAEVGDSGEWRCIAQYHANQATSSVQVEVSPLATESSCVDNPQFKNCNLIVNAKYCNNKIYGKYCCDSCRRAGQLLDTP